MWRLIAATLTLVLTTGPLPASASRSIPDGHFRIQNVKSGLYLQSPTRHPGAPDVVQERESSVGRQEFKAVPRGAYDAMQQVLLFRNIGINGGGITSGAQAVLASPDGRVNQDWTLRAQPGGVYELVNRGSGLCLGIDSASLLPGMHARQYRCDGFANQRWRFTPW